jgi:alanine racemase
MRAAVAPAPLLLTCRKIRTTIPDMKSSALSWIEIDAAALEQNIKAIESNLHPDCRMVPVIKANAYGHGYLEIARLLDDKQFPYLGVHNLEEALLLRSNGIGTNILILGYVPLTDLSIAVENGFDFVVYNSETLQRLAEVATEQHPARCHLKLETGTNRQGVTKLQLPEFLDLFKNTPHLHLVGVSTHFANIEDTTDHSYAESQFNRYLEMKQAIEAAGLAVERFHLASSAASLLFPHTHFNLARVGIALYGLWPSKETYLSYRLSGKQNQILKPVLSWKTIVSQIKNVNRGEYIGYGTTYRATANLKIAVIPIGYYDGYDRQLSNCGHVLINGMRAPVRGRICMDIFMVDITDIPNVTLENEVVLIGRSGEETIRAEDIAGWANTINYEVVSRLGAHLERRVINLRR